MPGEDGHGRWPDAALDETLAEVGSTRTDGAGRARMVDVTTKPWTHRRALARGRVRLGAESAAALAGGPGASLPGQPGTWSDLFEAARVAGVQAAKQTSGLIPLCHSLPSSTITVGLAPAAGAVEVQSRAEVVGPTGIEMEALVACTVAALTVVTALVVVDPLVTVEGVALWEKSGGRSGTWVRR